MFDWLFEGLLTIYILIACVVVVFLALWYRDRHNRWLLTAALVASLMLVYFALDKAVETKREEIRRKIQEMANAVNKKNTEGIFKHVSERFDLGGVKKSAFRQLADAALQSGKLKDLVVWEEKYPDEKDLFVFRAKGTVPGGPQHTEARIRSEWVRDPDGQWRMKTFLVQEHIGNRPIELLPFMGQ